MQYAGNDAKAPLVSSSMVATQEQQPCGIYADLRRAERTQTTHVVIKGRFFMVIPAFHTSRLGVASFVMSVAETLSNASSFSSGVAVGFSCILR